MDTAEEKLKKTKLAVETVKHITTLSSGSIVLLATFVGQFPKPLKDPASLVVAVVCLLVCLGAGILYLFVAAELGDDWRVGEVPPQRSKPLRVSVALMFLSFMFGIVALGIFALSNIG